MDSYKIAVDDNILLKDSVSTAGSKILYNFVPPFNSDVADKLAAAGINDIIRTKPNEFGVSLTGGFGCVDSVAEGGADIGIGCDINGSIRGEASKKGVCFIKPTYGTVSRFGLVSTAASMEQIGVACRDIETGFKALSLIAGLGPPPAADHLKDMKIGFPTECKELMAGTARRLSGLGAKVGAFDPPHIEQAAVAAYIISAAETSNSISRFDGIKFGYRTENYSNLEDIYVKSRTECFTFETKLFTLIGMLVLTKEKYGDYFDKSQKVRRLIKDGYDLVFNDYDAIMTPVEYTEAGSGDEYREFCSSYKNLGYLALPNLTGRPALAIPGVQFIVNPFGEDTLYRLGAACYGI